MAGIDKAAIGFSIAITVIGVAVAMVGSEMQQAGTSFFPSDSGSLSASTAPKTDPFADVAEKAKSQQAEREEAMKEQLTMTQKEEMKGSVSLSTPKVEPVPKVEPAPKTSEPKTVEVNMPAGTSVPGCEETDSCYVPSSVNIQKGDTVKWTNSDTAAHTVTSGTPDAGPDGNFDSSLVMGKGSFSNKFDQTGSYDYFCMVHPWMQGNVRVG